MTIEQRIIAYAKDPEIQMEALAMLKVGHDKGDPAREIMSRIIASLLMKFHGIPLKKGLN